MLNFFQKEVNRARDLALAALQGKSLRDGPANYQRGWEAVGGWLAMSEAELVFVAHRFNLQSDPLVILRSRIVNCGPCWTKFLGIIPLLPNSMAITTDDGKTHRFVLWNRGVWIAELQNDEL